MNKQISKQSTKKSNASRARKSRYAKPFTTAVFSIAAFGYLFYLLYSVVAGFKF